MNTNERATTAITHIAGTEVVVGGRFLRQRCAWCDEVLLDYDLANVAVAITDDEPPSPPGTWPAGRLVTVDGVVSRVHDEGAPLPDDACCSLAAELAAGRNPFAEENGSTPPPGDIDKRGDL